MLTVPDSFSPSWRDYTPSDIWLWWCLSYLPVTVVGMTYLTLHRPGETALPLTSVCGVWGPGDSSPPSVCLSGSDSGPPLLHIAQHQGHQSQSTTITKYLQATLYHLRSFYMVFFIQVSFLKIPNELKKYPHKTK